MRKVKSNLAIRNATSFDELLDIQYGKIGTEVRDKFEEKAKNFIISELIKNTKHQTDANY